MPSSFQNAAGFYDVLARLVYGSAQADAQNWLLRHLRPGDNILIVGGGTGAILEEIADTMPAGLQITYVEMAPKMMQLSQKRRAHNVTFINAGIEAVEASAIYDAVITPFFLDNFTQPAMQQHMAHINAFLKPGGLWLNSSFQQTGRWWQPVLLRAMFLFFGLVCGLEATRLPGISDGFSALGYKSLAEKTFYKDFILSVAYKKMSEI